MRETLFLKQDLEAGIDLLNNKKIGQIIFSQGTYQVEIKDKNEIFWPFLQINSLGEIVDCFCTCQKAENDKSCPHLCAAYYTTYRGHKRPLHLRFEDSLWNHLAQIGSKRHGFETTCLQKDGSKGYYTTSLSSKKLFSIKPLTQKGEKFLKETIEQRVEETEETSLKFSNLPQEELLLYKEKRPSFSLAYELSFWSDIAKFLMLLQEEGEKYHIQFESSKEEIPTGIIFLFADVECYFYIAKVNWDDLVLSLTTVDSPLKVFEYQNIVFEKLLYHPREKIFELFTKKLDIDFSSLQGAIKISDQWQFHSKIGFYAGHVDPLLKNKVIEKDQVISVLYTHQKLLEKYLENTKVHEGICHPSYELSFDKNDDFHIDCYLFEPKDLQSDLACRFDSWVFLPNKGFYQLGLIRFPKLKTCILKQNLNQFVSQNKLWLNKFEGFQTHLTSIEIYYSYEIDSLMNLRFYSSSDAFENVQGVIDLDDWVYIFNRGFYAKSSSKLQFSLKDFKMIKKEDISSFIESHEEDLERVRNFFSAHQPIEKYGLNIELNESLQICIEPKFRFSKGYNIDKVLFFDHFTYVKGEGFSKMPQQMKIPGKYSRKIILDKKMEENFLFNDLPKLKPFILHLDARLKAPKHLFLKVNSVEGVSEEEKKIWKFSFSYKSEFGAAHLFDLYQSMKDARNKIVKTNAGLFFLDNPQFNWIRRLDQDRFKANGDIELSVLEWIRLQAFEHIELPSSRTSQGEKSLKILKYLDSFCTEDTLDLSNFKSSLRPYQYLGTTWLWFLYIHGLSGLLCDEMGLGKTHQAMALLASSMNERAKSCKKYLIVCPTSVIYHWENLLEKFLPQAKVLVFYGVQRSLKGFCANSDILLTSYGTLRSERQVLKDIEFKIAIYDELQIAKNAASQTHKALKAIKACMKLGLTGTPIENRLLELHSLFDIVLPDYLPKESVYKELFVTPIEKNLDREKIHLLKGLIKPFLLRRKKEEVLQDLPEKIEEISYVDLSQQQAILYKQVFNEYKKDIFQSIEDTTKPVPYLHIFSLFNALKQICDHPALFKKNPDNYEAYSSGKWELFKELLSEARESGQKVVVFSQYLSMLDIIEDHLSKNNVGYAQIRGSTKNRKAQLDKFKTDPYCEVFIGSLQASGVGIDLVSASVVIHYDRWWNPAKENQATDRVHRIGQNRGVQVFKLVTKHTIEEHIHRLIEKKEGLLKDIVGYDDQAQIKQLEREEIIVLLKQLNKDLSL